MTKLMQELIESLSRDLGNLLVGTDGGAVSEISDMRAAYLSLLQQAEDELQSSAADRNGDRDVAHHKKAVKTCDTVLREAGGRIDSLAEQLGDQLCDCHERGLAGSISGLQEAKAAWQSLRDLRTEYDKLDPGPKAGLWARGKAAAQRVLLSGKIFMQEVKTKELLRTAAKKAYAENLPTLLSIPELVRPVESLKDAHDQYKQRQEDKESAAKLLAEVQQRCAAIEQSDTRRAALQEAAEAKKQELARHFISLMDAAREQVRQAVHQHSPLDASTVPISIDGVSEALDASYLKVKQAEAELAADAERKPRARIVEKCPKCGQKSYELYDTKTIDYEEDIRSKWRHPEGFLSNYPISNGVRVQMLCAIYTRQDYFRCPKCGHRGEGKTYVEEYTK